jgi:hypothetical protein
MSSPDAPQWTTALQGGLLPLYNKGVFDILPRTSIPSGHKPIRSRWVLSKKMDADNNVSHKAPGLVGCGNTQIKGIDFFDASAPVAAKESIRTVLAIAAHDNR